MRKSWPSPRKRRRACALYWSYKVRIHSRGVNSSPLNIYINRGSAAMATLPALLLISDTVTLAE